jgi:acyl-coenzyme A thioesterase PaaI-like protein
MARTPAEQLLATWRTCARLPLGRALFGLAVARMVPYSASIRPEVERLEPGHAQVALRDRRAVRNHLGSVHALALANLGEFASGIAMMAALPPEVRGIVIRIETEYRKKARGRITAVADAAVPEVRGPVDHVVEAQLTDAAADEVARVRVHWKLDLRP